MRSRLWFWVDHEKDGPGVNKDDVKEQPKGFLGFWRVFFQHIDKAMLSNLLYIVCCIPLVTIGPATAAATKLWRNFARDEETGIFSDFFETFKENWKQSLIVSLINLPIWAITLFSAYYYYNVAQNSFIFTICFGIVVSILAVFIMMHFYLYYMIVTFDFSIKDLYKNAFILSISALPKNAATLACLAVYAVLFYIAVYFQSAVFFTGLMAFIIVIIPAFYGMLICYNVAPVIQKYIIDPYEEKMRKENPEEYEPDELDDPIFTDLGRTDSYIDPGSDNDK